MNPWQIVPMSLAHYAALHALWGQTTGYATPAEDDSQAAIARYLARNPVTCFTALAQDAVIGGILCGHDGRRAFVHHACVAPEYQNAGVGKALWTAAANALHDEDIHKISLVCYAANPAGNAFWRKQGFTTREDLIYYNKLL